MVNRQTETDVQNVSQPEIEIRAASDRDRYTSTQRQTNTNRQTGDQSHIPVSKHRPGTVLFHVSASQTASRSDRET